MSFFDSDLGSTSTIQRSQDDWCVVESCTESGNASNSSLCTTVDEPVSYCAHIFHYTIPRTYIRVWDLLLLCANFAFAVFLIARLVCTCSRLRRTFVLFRILFFLAFTVCFSVMATNVVGMIWSYRAKQYKVLRLWLRCAILMTEISVITFGMFFKTYKNRRICLAISLMIVILFSMTYTAGEGLSEFLGDHSDLPCARFHFFTNGGMWFLFCSSFLLAVGYFTTYCIYYAGLHKRWKLPSKKSFYRYCLFLSCVNLLQSAASLLWEFGTAHQAVGECGICLTALTQFIYQTTFAPMIYWIFLNKFLKASSSASRQYRQPRNSDVASDEEDSTEHYNSGAVLLDKREYNSQSSLLSSTKYKTSRMVHSPKSKSPQPSFPFRSSSSYGSVDDDSTTDSAHAIQQI